MPTPVQHAARRSETRATVESVAAHAQVSRQTVSNALNAPERLRPETLERVLSSVRELGYRPSSAARSLRTNSTRVIGARLTPQQSETGGVLDRFMHALCEAAGGHGYDVLMFTAADDSAEIGCYEELIRRSAVDGFVLTGTHFSDPRADWLLDSDSPFVAFGRPWGAPRPRHCWVDVDGAAGTAAAVAHLAEQGHRRIAFLGWPERSGVGDDRRHGWFDEMRRRRLPVRGYELHEPDSLDSGARMAERLLDRAAPPTAFVCVSDAVALGAFRTLEDRRLRPGRDVAVVGFDDSPAAGLVRPGLTSVRQPLEEVARHMVELLLQRLTTPDGRCADRLLLPELVIRGSSGT